MNETLDARRARSLARLANRVSLGFRQAAEGGGARIDVPAAQKAVLVQLEESGTRITVIAHRLRVSKQAASRLVTELEARGLVERRPDPADGRALLVAFTRRGARLVEQTVDGFEAAERKAAGALGRSAIERLRHDLKALAEHLDPDGF